MSIIAKLYEKGVVKRFTIGVDYTKFGLSTMAYIGTRTTLDASVRESLFEFFESSISILKQVLNLRASPAKRPLLPAA